MYSIALPSILFKLLDIDRMNFPTSIGQVVCTKYRLGQPHPDSHNTMRVGTRLPMSVRQWKKVFTLLAVWTAVSRIIDTIEILGIRISKSVLFKSKKGFGKILLHDEFLSMDMDI